MSKTRNELRRLKLLFATYVTLGVFLFACLAYVYNVAQHSRDEQQATTEAAQEQAVEPDLATDSAISVEHVDTSGATDSDANAGEVAHDKEQARMPEFGYDYDYVVRVVAAESRGEPYEGQLAVAQCISETAKRSLLNPEEVVKQVSKNGTRQYAQPIAESEVTQSVRDACLDVFVYGLCATDEPIQYFYSTKNGFYSKWHENSLEFVVQIGNHKFFRA